VTGRYSSRFDTPSSNGRARDETPMSRSTRDDVTDDFVGERHVYEPHRVGLPNLRVYVRELWRRRQFAYELSSSSLRSDHFDTAFGQLWLVLNPLLLGLVYYVLVDILSPSAKGADFFAHLLAGLFAFYFISGSIQTGSKSVVGGGKLILNTAFPRVLLPLSSTLTAFMRFLPTFAVYIVVHIVAGLPFGWHLLWVLPVLAVLILFALGASMLFATLQVYFRDTSSFLPYFLRIWLYLSPILYYPEDVPERLKAVVHINPLFSILGNLSDVLVEGRSPDLGTFGISVAWAVTTFALGFLFFVSREREFAVRL
jgi:ABC-type polysaccharide/polyol phosphate export permease